MKDLQDLLSMAFSPLITDAVEGALTKLMKDGKLTAPIQPENQKEPDVMWTITEFCDYVRVSKPTYHAFVHRGLIHPRKCGQRTLISRAEVMEKLEAGVLGRYKRSNKSREE